MKTPWIKGVRACDVARVKPNVRDALEHEQRRVFAARIRVWCEWRIQQFKREHSLTKLDEVLSASAELLLREVKKTADEFFKESSRERTTRRKRATYARKKAERTKRAKG